MGSDDFWGLEPELKKPACTLTMLKSFKKLKGAADQVKYLSRFLHQDIMATIQIAKLEINLNSGRNFTPAVLQSQNEEISQQHTLVTSQCQLSVEQSSGYATTHTVTCEVFTADYVTGTGLEQIPKRGCNLIMHSFDYGLGLYKGDEVAADHKKMYACFNICRMLVDWGKTDKCVTCAFVMPEKIGECIQAMQDAGLAPQGTQVITWVKPTKFSMPKSHFSRDVEYMVLGFWTEDKLPYPKPKSWLGMGVDLSKEGAPSWFAADNLRQKFKMPGKSDPVNMTEMNPYVAYGVSPNSISSSFTLVFKNSKNFV